MDKSETAVRFEDAQISQTAPEEQSRLELEKIQKKIRNPNPDDYSD